MLTRLNKTKFRLCPADREAYGGPEWVVFDPDALVDLPGSELEQMETATGFRIAWFWLPSLRISARGQRAALWVARRQAGLGDDWNDCDPKILAADAVIITDSAEAGEGGDADPPVLDRPAASDAGPPAGPETGSPAGSPVGP